MVKKRKPKTPLIIENHPPNYEGYPFITLIQYRQEHLLTIIDNVLTKEIRCFVLDLCNASNINEELIINIANHWFENNSKKYPLSFEFSKQNMIELISPIYKKFNINYISRVIGPLFTFPMNNSSKIKRKKLFF